MSQPIVVAEDVSFTYAARTEPALRGVSFTVAAGTWVLLAGATGSGKSTLLRALAGLIPLCSAGAMDGRVLLAGRDTRAMSPAELARLRGFVQQSPDDQLCATRVDAEVAFGLENLAVPPAEIGDRVAEALRIVGLASFAQRRTAELSGGEKQRLALAAALAMRPQILFLDEPLSQLDPLSSQEFLRTLERLRATGMTIIMAEHRLEDVAPRVDVRLAMSGGRIAIPANGFATEESPSFPVNDGRARVAAEGEVVLRVADLRFQFPVRRGVKSAPLWSGVSFELRAGERVALVGPNGAGKSTLLEVLSWQRQPSSGAVEFPASARPAWGLVPQNPDLVLFHDTTEGELQFAGRALGQAAADIVAEVANLKRQFGLEAVGGRSPLSLSQGERLRVAIAATAAANPRVLMLDEPLTGQDTAAVAKIMSALTQKLTVAESHGSLLFSTHDLPTVFAWADRVLVLSGGRLLADTTPEQFRADQALQVAAGLRLAESEAPA